MNNDWKDYLLQNGAKQDDNALFVFNDVFSDRQDTDNGDIICDLSHFSTVVIAGEDAAEFIQGQFTNDVYKVNENNSQISAICNNKGRMIANFRLFNYQQNYFTSIRNDLVDRSISHLQNYILRAQIAIQDISEQLIHIGISGNNADSLLSAFIVNLNTTVDSISHNDSYIAIRVSGETPRYEIFCSLEHAKTLWQAVASKAKVVNSAYWDYLNIQNGLPFIDNNTSEEFVPQMVNMDLINGVSFEKGCYTGQEIVARMHYLGKLKKRCYKINIDTDKKPETGDKLFAENARAGQNTGAIVNVEKNPESGYDALAVIQIADTESKLFLNDANGPVITVKELPYSFDSE